MIKHDHNLFMIAYYTRWFCMEVVVENLAMSSRGHLVVRYTYIKLCNSIDMQYRHVIVNEFNKILEWL